MKHSRWPAWKHFPVHRGASCRPYMMLWHCPALEVLGPSPPGTVEGDRQPGRSVCRRSSFTVLVLHEFISIGEGMKVRDIMFQKERKSHTDVTERGVQKSLGWMGKQVTVHECNPEASPNTGKQTSPSRRSWTQLILSSSTSKRRVAFDGMTGGNPRAPYPCRYVNLNSLNVPSV